MGKHEDVRFGVDYSSENVHKDDFGTESYHISIFRVYRHPISFYVSLQSNISLLLLNMEISYSTCFSWI